MTIIHKHNNRHRSPNKTPKWEEIYNNSKRLSPSSQYYLHKGKIYWGPPVIRNFKTVPKKYDEYKTIVNRFKKAGLWEDGTTTTLKIKNLQTYAMTLNDFIPDILMKQELEIHNRGIAKITLDEIDSIEVVPNAEIMYFFRVNGNDAKLLAEEFKNTKGNDIENCILTIRNTHGVFEVK